MPSTYLVTIKVEAPGGDFTDTELSELDDLAQRFILDVADEGFTPYKQWVQINKVEWE